MKTAILLHSVKEAEYCVAQRLHEGRVLLSTNPCVDVYLKERHGIECVCVSRFLSDEELDAQMNRAPAAVDRVLAALDERIAPLLNAHLGLEMKYFAPVYSYIGKHYLLGVAAFVEALRNTMSAKGLGKVEVFDSRYQDFMDVPPDMAALIARLLPGLACETLPLPAAVAGGAGRLVRLKRLLKKAGNFGVWTARFVKTSRSVRARLRTRRPGAKTILLCEPLYFLDFLFDSLPEYDLFLCDDEGYPAGVAQDAPDARLDRGILDAMPWGVREDPLEDFFLQTIRKDFSGKIARHIRPALALKKIQESRPIALAVWGNIGGFPKYLLFEYLRSAGVQIVGTQHGNSYVDQVAAWAWSSDFDHCDHFISWGFTKEDLARTYPGVEARFEIHPLGAVLPERPRTGKTPVDIVFPMTWSMSIFDGGPARIKPDTIDDRQVQLLEHLNSLDGLSIYVKPPPGMTLDTCVAFSVSHRLKNLRFIGNMPYLRFLEKYAPRLVVVDYPASPLYQSLPLDADILLMPDFISPYEKQALAELRTRVHYCVDLPAASAALDLFAAGKLPQKRGDDYDRHYVHKPGSRENTVRLIRDLAG